ncbi:NLR family CARD domain-containing protein 3 isoform X2 [Tamandua tetradactyla]|uniref:NLR family CARD domain-containing protein 3 isoform X2 n=1 Tax=Tamandua tetradactyla TaxID=48850 RepID=UPI0040548D96
MRQQEAGPGGSPGSRALQVKALVDQLAGQDCRSPQVPQTPDGTPETPPGLHSTDSGPRRPREATLGGAGPRQGCLLLVEGLSDLQRGEHDFTQVEATRGRARSAKPIALERLFLPLSRVSAPPRVSITVGVAGVGKSTLVRHFFRLWAQGQLGKDFSLVLPVTFRELNTHEKLSAHRLVGPAPATPARVLLILDGLDEGSRPLDFSNTPACSDPQREIQVDGLVTNIIRGHLFPEVSVWVTSRPGAAAQIPGGLVDRMTEIRGFTEAEVALCLEQMFPEDPALAHRVLSQVRADRALYLMCTVPAFCRLAGSALGHWGRHRPGPPDAEPPPPPPQTLSELYAWYFRMALSGEAQDGGPASPRREQVAQAARKMVGTLGRLAFHGLLKGKYVFYEADLKAFGVDPAVLQSPPGSHFLQREDTRASAAAYCFTHLSLQEFAAAAYYQGAARRAVFDLFADGSVSWPRLGFLAHFRAAAQRATRAEDGSLDVFLRFLSGLLSPRVNALLAGILLVPGEHRAHGAPAAEILQACVRPATAVSARAVNVLRCLHELQRAEVARGVEAALGGGGGGLASLGGPAPPVALAYLLQVSDACAHEANLSLGLSPAALQSLLPQLLYCRGLRLDANQFQDPVMELLGSILSGKDCCIETLSLAENQIGNKGARALARSLLVNRSLTTLDLRCNNIGPPGAKALADALKINRTLASLSLQSNLIKDDGARSVAEALAASRTLSVLHLQKTAIGAPGAQHLSHALKQNRSLKELMFSSNSIGDEGTKALAEALKVNEGLESLDLQSNSISDAGVAALTSALCTNQALLSLSLRENSISPEGAQAVAHALRANGTLQSLDLTANLLHDQGARAIAAAVGENRALTSLHLQWNFLQAGAAIALGAALQLNRSLASLDLQENAIGDEGASAVASALKANTALTTLHLQVTSIGDPGAQALGEALAVNRTLEILDLRGNAIGIAGAKALANALKVNSSLRRLNLQENSLGMDGAICVTTALSRNHRLQYINLQGNHIGESGARMLSEAIKTNAPTCTVEM